MQPVHVERRGTTAVAHLRGELRARATPALYGSLRQLARRRDVRRVVVDFAEAGRIDSSGVAAIALVERMMAKREKRFELAHVADHHRAALALVPREPAPAAQAVEPPGALERIGERLVAASTGAGELASLVGESARRGVAVATRRERLPRGAIVDQLARMGVDAVLVVGLLACLLGMTTAFQGATQLQRFGADVFVADLIGVSMVRELAPLVTAIVLTGRTGAAIAAELGTMRVRSEIDALAAMGVSPVRFLVVPRVVALAAVGPALTLMAMFLGILGGMVVAVLVFDMPAAAYWARVAERVDLADFAHGLGKSLAFAVIIGLTGCHLGMRARNDASGVGAATTRTVVTSVFCIVVVDAIFATASTLWRYW